MTAPFRFPRFFVTTPSPCPYLPGKTERKVFTELNGANAVELNDALGRIGFRRSQSVAYRPSCPNCTACVSVRVVSNEFIPNATQRKLIRRNSDLVVTACKPWTTTEQFDLLRSYLHHRHPDGGMVGMDETDFADMVEQTPVQTSIIEYREPRADGLPGKLVGACLTDHQADGLSMVYSFYDTGPTQRPGLGSFIILDHILRTRQMNLPYVYLGYWVAGAKRMEYKTNYQPLELLTPGGWITYDPAQGQDNAAVAAATQEARRDGMQVFADLLR